MLRRNIILIDGNYVKIMLYLLQKKEARNFLIQR